MRPVLFNIFGSQIYSYYAFITLGIFTGLYFFYRYSRISKIHPANIIDISIISIISGYLGGRIFHVLFSMPGYYLENPEQVLYFWKGGYAIYGAIIVPVFFIYLYVRRKNIKLTVVTDALAPAISIGTAIGRIGCLLEGCCYGKVTSATWAINGPNGQLVHPTQIYLSLHGLIMFFILAWSFKRKKYDGYITYLYFILYSSGRFIIEIFRADERGGFLGLSSFQIISIIILVWSTQRIVANSRRQKNA